MFNPKILREKTDTVLCLRARLKYHILCSGGAMNPFDPNILFIETL